jgi:hypothetical protein
LNKQKTLKRIRTYEPTQQSHTHCQAASADPQAKTWQRVCLPHPEKIELKKFSDPSENKKYATAQPLTDKNQLLRRHQNS